MPAPRARSSGDATEADRRPRRSTLADQEQAGGPRGCAATHANSVRGAARKSAGTLKASGIGNAMRIGAGGGAIACDCKVQ